MAPLVAVYGGSFDPPHEGHLDLAHHLVKCLSIDKLIFVPAHQNPFKPQSSTTATDRLNMLRLAISERPCSRFEISEIEIQKLQKSFTIDTIRALEPGEKIIVIGNELFVELSQWKEAAQLCRLVHTLVVTRDKELPYQPDVLLQQLKLSAENDPHSPSRRWIENRTWIDKYEYDALPYRSTDLRREITQRWQVGDLFAPPHGIQRLVWQYIKENRLYSV